MYYYIDIIKRREKFGIIWISAFDRVDFSNRKILAIVRGYDIERCCDDILRYSAEGRENCPRMNLYVTSTLLYGLCKVFRQMSTIALGEAAGIYAKWGEKCRLMSIKDVKRRYRRPVGFAAIEEHGDDQMHLMKYRKRKASSKICDGLTEEGKEETFRPLEEEELAEMLREADISTMPHLVDPKSITLQELPEQFPVAPELAEQSFGGEGLESLLPEVRDILLGIEPSIDPNVQTGIPVPDELVAQAAPEVTLQVPPEVVPEIVPEIPQEVVPEVVPEIPQEVVPEIPPEVPQEVVPEVPQEVVPEVPQEVVPEVPQEVVPEVPQEVVPEVPQEVVPEVLPELIPAQEEMQVEERVPAEVAPQERERSVKNRKKDTVITIPTRRRPIQRIDFMEKLVEREEKWGKLKEVDICETLLPAADLIMNVPGDKDPNKIMINFPALYSQLQQDYEIYGEMQQIRAGLENLSMRHSIGSPTPTMVSRSIQSKPSPSLVQSDGKMSFADMNLLPLETITEMLPAEDLQVLTELSMVVEDPMKGVEELEELAGDGKESQTKRPRSEKEGPSSERSRIQQEEPPAKQLRLEEEAPQSPSTSVSTGGRNENMFMSLFESLEEKNEVIKFADLAPPESTTKLEAARLFTALLGLEKKRVIKTQQVESFGDIFIYRQQEDLSSP